MQKVTTNIKELVEKPKKTLSDFLISAPIKIQIDEMVGMKDGQRFIASILSAFSSNKKLLGIQDNLDFNTLLSAAFLGESLKLMPGSMFGHYHFVPFNNSKTGQKDISFIIGVRGIIQLALRSGCYKKINAMEVKRGELIRHDPFAEIIELKFIDDEIEREKRETIGYFARIETNGFSKELFWSKRKMKNFAERYSKSFKYYGGLKTFEKLEATNFKEISNYSDSYWHFDFDGQSNKTMLRHIITHWGIMTPELQFAFEKDIIDLNDTNDFQNSEIIDIPQKNIEKAEILNAETGNEILFGEK